LVLTNFSIHDWTGGYRAITKRVYEAVHEEMNTERFSGYTFQLGFLHKTIQKGFKVTEVPFHFVDRKIGESKLGAESIKNTLMYILKVRFQEILNNRIFKFLVVGGLGAVIQLVSLQLWRLVAAYELASILSIETAVLSNFILNNFWTFSDRKAKLVQYPLKFVQFNLASSGSIIIQYIIALAGKFIFGLFPLFIIPILNKSFDTGTLYAIIGILVGMFWNFFAYSHFVWKKK